MLDVPGPLSADTVASSLSDTPVCTPRLRLLGRQRSKQVPGEGCQRSGTCSRSLGPRLLGSDECSRSTHRRAVGRWCGIVGLRPCPMFAGRNALDTAGSLRSRIQVLIHVQLLPALVQSYLKTRLWKPYRRLRRVAVGSFAYRLQLCRCSGEREWGWLSQFVLGAVTRWWIQTRCS